MPSSKMLSPRITHISSSPAKFSASPSACAMPPASSCTLYVNRQRKSLPEPSSVTTSPMCSTPVTTRISSIPASVSLRTGWKIIGSRPTGRRCLLVTLVSGNRRDPVPPARMMPFIAALVPPRTARVVSRPPERQGGNQRAQQTGDRRGEPRLERAGDGDRVSDHGSRPQQHREPHAQRHGPGKRHAPARPLQLQREAERRERGRDDVDRGGGALCERGLVFPRALSSLLPPAQ